METVTIRELRQNWPRIERRLKVAPTGLLVTRDGTPVAHLAPPPVNVSGTRAGFSAAAHRQWRLQMWKSGAPRTSSAAWLAKAREEERIGRNR